MAIPHWKIEPGKGIGPVKFGMTRQEVRELLADEPGACPYDSRIDIDYFFDASYQVSYSPRGKVEFIQLAYCGSEERSFEVSFEGMNVFDMRAADLLEHLQEFDEPDKQLSSSIHSIYYPRLILALGEPGYDDEWHAGIPDRYKAIGLGNKDYLEIIRGIRDNLRKKKWSDNQVPAARFREVVDGLKAQGAEVALDEKGNVKRLEFRPFEAVSLMQKAFNISIHDQSLKRPLMDEDLGCLKKLPTLEALFLGGNRRLTPAAIDHLIPLKNLKGVDLANTLISRSFLAKAASWPKLVELDVDEIDVVALKRIGELKNLERLSIDIVPKAEAELSHLTKLRRLKKLSISGVLTDKGLEMLAGFKSLPKLIVFNTKVTKSGVARLQNSLPDLRVHSMY